MADYFPFRARLSRVPKERMRFYEPGFEFRMGLSGHENRCLGSSINSTRRLSWALIPLKTSPPFESFRDIPDSLRNDGDARPRSDCPYKAMLLSNFFPQKRRSRSPAASCLPFLLFLSGTAGCQSRMGRFRVELRAVCILHSADASREFYHGHLKTKAKPQQGNIVLAGETDGFYLALYAALAETAGDDDAIRRFLSSLKRRPFHSTWIISAFAPACPAAVLIASSTDIGVAVSRIFPTRAIFFFFPRFLFILPMALCHFLISCFRPRMPSRSRR